MYGKGRLALLAAATILVIILAPWGQNEQGRQAPSLVTLRQPGATEGQAEQYPDVIGGEAVQANAFPWVAAIVSARYQSAYHGLLCAGTLIDPEWILTAAHCVRRQGQTLRPGEVEIVLDRVNLLSKTGKRIAAIRIEAHPAFNPRNGDFDIALVQLATPVDVQPVALSGRDPQALAQQDVEGLLVGWGTTTWSIGQMGTYPAQLQQAALPLVDSRMCQQSYRQRSGRNVSITENMLCAGTMDNARDACVGDSGGPLLFRDEDTQRWRQLGIVSWGFGCAVPGFYGVYTNLLPFHTWIQEVTQQRSNAVTVTPRPSPIAPTPTPTATATPMPTATPDPGSTIRLPYIPVD